MRAASMFVGVTIVMVAATALLNANAAEAGITTEGCQARKLKAQGKFLSCRAAEVAKGFQGKPVDLAACDVRFSGTLAKLNAQAAIASIECRYHDNNDGTVTDLDTGLQWEQKTNDATVHDASNSYSWSSSGTDADGTLFTAFLAGFNVCQSEDGDAVTGGFAGHCDWRLPSVVELRTIQLPFPCGAGPCINPVFGPTAPDIYWSATSDATNTVAAWTSHFYNVNTSFVVFKNLTFFARAVRGGW